MSKHEVLFSPNRLGSGFLSLDSKVSGSYLIDPILALLSNSYTSNATSCTCLTTYFPACSASRSRMSFVIGLTNVTAALQTDVDAALLQGEQGTYGSLLLPLYGTRRRRLQQLSACNANFAKTLQYIKLS